MITQLHRLGDLPVFSATVNQIRQISASKESDAMALAMAVMKDANLSAKVLRLANNKAFNPSGSKVSSLSRAVVILGFEQIQNLSMTLKLLESLRSSEVDKELDQLLVRSFLNASLSRELAEKANLRSAESIYLNGLLHSLGEILVAYTLPEIYRKIGLEWSTGKVSWLQAQLNHMGAEFSDFGQEFASLWGFPKNLIHSMDYYTASQLKGRDHTAHMIAAGGHQLIAKLYGRGSDDKVSFSKLSSLLAEELGIDSELVGDAVHQSYKLASHLSDEVGLPLDVMKPTVVATGDEMLDELSSDVSFYLHTQEQKQRAEYGSRKAEKEEAKKEAQHSKLEKALDDFNKLAQSDASASQLIRAALEGLHQSTNVDRALFLMRNKKTEKPEVKLSVGAQIDKADSFFENLKDPVITKLFQGLMKQKTTLLVEDAREPSWKDRLPSGLVTGLGCTGFMISSVQVNDRLLGLIYLDKLDEPLNSAEFDIVNQFLLLLKMGLEGDS